jgi:hypothetical protein
MKTFTVGEKEYTVPDIGVTAEEPLQFKVNEGEFEGVEFAISDMQMDEVDESQLNYNVSTNVEDIDMDRFKDVLNDFIIMILHEQLLREEAKE